MHIVLLDTNFLMIPGQFGVDIFREIDRICVFPYSLAVLEGTIRELEGIHATKGKDARDAKLALDIVKTKNINSVRPPNADIDVDSQLLDVAGAKPDIYILATSDRELRDKALAIGVTCIIMRSKSHLAIMKP